MAAEVFWSIDPSGGHARDIMWVPYFGPLTEHDNARSLEMHIFTGEIRRVHHNLGADYMFNRWVPEECVSRLLSSVRLARQVPPTEFERRSQLFNEALDERFFGCFGEPASLLGYFGQAAPSSRPIDNGAPEPTAAGGMAQPASTAAASAAVVDNGDFEHRSLPQLWKGSKASRSKEAEKLERKAQKQQARGRK